MLETTAMNGNLPPEYVPFSTVNFCSNILINVKFIIEIDGNFPILIGKGTTPLVWISAPTDLTRRTWSYVVQANRRLHPDFKIKSEPNKVIVSAGEETIIAVSTEGGDEAVVTEINLEPIGLRIRGDQNGLTVGTSNLRGNSFHGARVFLGLSG